MAEDVVLPPRSRKFGRFGWNQLGPRLGRVWLRLKLVYLFFLPVRFSLLAVAVVGLAFLGTNAGADMLRALVEYDACLDTRPHVGRLVVFVLVANAFALQVWYWARQILRVKPPETVPEDDYLSYTPPPDRFPGLVRWLPRGIGLFAYAIPIVAFFLIGRSYTAKAPTAVRPLLVALALSALAFLVFTKVRRDLLDKRGSTVDHREPKDFDPVTKGILVLTVLAQISFFVWVTIDPVSITPLGAGSLVLLTAALWVPIGTALVMLGIRTRFPILTVLFGLGLLLSPIADWNHVIRTIEGAAALAPRRDAVAGLVEWYDRVAPLHPQGEVPLFVVATEGGGIRAAYWTAAVLAALEDSYHEDPQHPGNLSFADHLFAISGVSGGSLGAAVFEGLLLHGPAAADPAERVCPGKDAETMQHEQQTLRYAARRVLTADALTPTLAGLSQPDLAQRFLPVGFPDRQQAIEEAWEHGWSVALDGDDLFASGLLRTLESHHDLPALFFNGTMVETGDRIITSNYRIHPDAGSCHGIDPKAPAEPLCQFRNAFDAFHHLGSDIPFSTSAGMSARFPYVSPAGRLPRDGGDDLAGHVVDGGYFEVSAAVTAAEIVTMIDRATRRPGLERLERIHPYVIVIDFESQSKLCRAKPKECHADGAPRAFEPVPDARGPSPGKPTRWVNELLSPVRALFKTRNARGSQAVGDLQELLPVAIGKEPDVIEFRLIERRIPLPLSWILSQRARVEIDGAIGREGGNLWALERVGRALGGSQPTIPLAARPTDPVAMSAAASAAASGI